MTIAATEMVAPIIQRSAETYLEAMLRMFERRELLTRLLLHIGVSKSIAYEDAIRLEHDMSDDTYQTMKRHAETKALRQANSL